MPVLNLIQNHWLLAGSTKLLVIWSEPFRIQGGTHETLVSASGCHFGRRNARRMRRWSKDPHRLLRVRHMQGRRLPGWRDLRRQQRGRLPFHSR